VVCNIKSYLPRIKGLLGGLLGKIPKADHIQDGHVMYDDIMSRTPADPPHFDIDPTGDLAVILYTGGTTGVPKGAGLSHANFYHNIAMMQEWGRIEHEPGGPLEPLRTNFHTFLGVLPWYHSFGLTTALLCSCYISGRLICIPDPRAGKPPFTEVLKAVQQYRPTFMPAVPTIFVAFTNHALLDRYDLSSLMACFSGGAPLPPEVCKRFEEKTGAIIFEGYGLSETSPIATVNPTTAELRKVGSIGFPVPNTHIKIVDLKDGTSEMPRGEDGEIAICGPQVMTGYWNKPEENEAAFRKIDGRRYFLSGDIGHVDDQGYIVVTDRKKDMILRGGFNVYPREVEDILYTHPKVALAAVIGIPDPQHGENVKAYIKLNPGETVTEEELLEFCKQNMAGYKRPRAVEFRDDIPLSNIGKVLRRVLRDEEVKKIKSKTGET
jgi:long-chain acyl-CoA synthetase